MRAIPRFASGPGWIDCDSSDPTPTPDSLALIRQLARRAALDSCFEPKLPSLGGARQRGAVLVLRAVLVLGVYGFLWVSAQTRLSFFVSLFWLLGELSLHV